MSERRVDPFTGRGVLIAAARRGLARPRPGGLPAPPGRCPFCPGHESLAEPTLARWPAEGDWQVRVVPNKYPLVSEADGLGRHEVVIDARAHDASLATLSEAHREAWLDVLRGRVRDLSGAPGVAAVVPFRNRGVRAGSSQPHPHSQLVATAWVPGELAARAAILARGPVYAEQLARELAGPRLLEADDALAVFCPYASTEPYALRFAPRAPRGGFEAASDAELAALAAALGRATRALDTLGLFDFNLLFRTPPLGAPAAVWYVDLLPRHGDGASFELATLERVNLVPPEEAARAYRERYRA